MNNKNIITALVKNRAGVLTRISGLFARRCYNIDSLSVCNTEDDKYSRMSIVVTEDDATFKQIIRQLDKLPDVIKVSGLNNQSSVLRELLLIKINITTTQLPEIETTCNIYKAKTIDLSPESVVIELTGESSKLDAFIKVLEPYGIIEMARTGLVALMRGKESINDLEDYNELI